MKKTTCSLLRATLILALVIPLGINLRAETIVTAEFSSGFLEDNFGPVDEAVSRVSNLDTETGELSRRQYYTTRGIGDFTAMARSGDGTLYAVHEPNRLVTIDETTGVATDVAKIHDSSGFYSIKVPGLAFVGSELYAVIKRENFIEFKVLAAPPSIDTGFILVKIDLATGETTDSGIYIGGQNNGRGHGLGFDPGINSLVHFYYEQAVGDAPTSLATVEVIDTVTNSVAVASYTGGSSSTQPYSFSSVAALGGGQFLVYDNRSSGDFFLVTIQEDLTGIVNDGPLPPVNPGGSYTFDSVRINSTNSIYGVRAMEKQATGNNVVIDHSGYLEIIDPSTGDLTEDDPIETSVGGFPAYFNSMATDPITGTIYALSSEQSRRPMSVSSKRGPKGGERGLYILDRNGPEEIELLDFDVPFLYPEEEERDTYDSSSSYYSDYINISSIAFDSLGNLYGFSHGYDGDTIVKINLRNGSLSIVATTDDLPYGYEHQFEYNPEDGCLYVLMYVTEDSNQLGLFKITPRGRVIEIGLSGDWNRFSEIPQSLVFTGLGNFFYTTNGPGGSALFHLSSSGVVTYLGDKEEELLLGDYMIQNFQTSALTTAGPLARGDVAVGAKRSRLKGNNIYSRSGFRQRILVRKRGRRLQGEYFAQVENDGSYPGLLEIRGNKGRRGESIKYKANGRNVTGTVVTGRPVGFSAGSKTRVVVSLKRRGGFRWVSNNRLAVSYGRAVDQGRVKTNFSRSHSPSSIKPISLF